MAETDDGLGGSDLHEAVVEEEAEGGGDGDEGLLELGLDGVADDSLDVGAYGGVVVLPEVGGGRVWELGEDKSRDGHG